MDKKAPGRTDHVTLSEKQTIGLLRASGASVRAIARETNRSRQTVRAALNSEEVQAIKDKARDLLDRNMVPMAESFLEAVKVGASKGRHEGAYHGLLSLGVISRPDDGMNQPRTVVNIGQINVGSGSSGLPLLEWRRDDGTYGPDIDEVVAEVVEAVPSTRTTN